MSVTVAPSPWFDGLDTNVLGRREAGGGRREAGGGRREAGGGSWGRSLIEARLLDPLHRRYIEGLGIGPGARTLEVGCGNGSSAVVRTR